MWPMKVFVRNSEDGHPAQLGPSGPSAACLARSWAFPLSSTLGSRSFTVEACVQLTPPLLLAAVHPVIRAPDGLVPGGKRSPACRIRRAKIPIVDLRAEFAKLTMLKGAPRLHLRLRAMVFSDESCPIATAQSSPQSSARRSAWERHTLVRWDRADRRWYADRGTALGDAEGGNDGGRSAERLAPVRLPMASAC